MKRWQYDSCVGAGYVPIAITHSLTIARFRWGSVGDGNGAAGLAYSVENIKIRSHAVHTEFHFFGFLGLGTVVTILESILFIHAGPRSRKSFERGSHVLFQGCPVFGFTPSH